MPGFGWAYINLDQLTDVGGATGSVLFKADDNNITGTAFLAYATGTNRVGVGLNFPTTLPEYQLDISASATQDTAVRILGDLQITGSAYISGNLEVESLHAHTVISSSNLIVRDPIMGLGFGDDANETGSAGDRGFIFGLNGNLNQAILWDQSVGSFIMGKAAAQGPDRTEYTIADSDLSILKVGALSASTDISASVNISASAIYASAVSSSVYYGLGTDTDTYIEFGDDEIQFYAGNETLLKLTEDGSQDIVTVGDGGDVDFQVRTSGGDHTLFVQGSNNNVGIGNNDPQHALAVAGDISASVNLSASAVYAGAISSSVYYGLGTDTNTYIEFGDDQIEFYAGNETLLTLTEATQDIVTIGDGGDVDFQVRTSGGDHTLFVQGSNNSVGIGNSDPQHALAVAGDISASVNLSASAVYANAVSSSVYYGLGTDTDTYIEFGDDQIEFYAGNETLLTLTEDGSQDKVTVGDGGDVDFQVRTSGGDHTLFVQGNTNRVGISNNNPTHPLSVTGDITGSGGLMINGDITGSHTLFVDSANRYVGIGRPSPHPNAQLYLSSSQPADVLQAMFVIEHPGTVDYPAENPCFIVTGSMPDDFFEARIGINKGSPAGALHVQSKGGDSLVVHEDKVAIGHTSATSKLQVRANTNDLFRVSRVDPGDDSIIHQPFFVSGNVGMEKFGSDLSTAIFINSGSAHIGNGLFMGGGQVVEYLDTTDEDSQDVSLSAAEFKKGIVVHTTTTGAGTVTMDTAANLISTLGLTANNMTAHCYYINDGDQDAVFSGAATGVTYADTGTKIKQNQGGIVLVRRTGASAVTVYIVGGS